MKKLLISVICAISSQFVHAYDDSTTIASSGRTSAIGNVAASGPVTSYLDLSRLQGPTGATGSVGATGPTGPIGATGVSGSKGNTGVGIVTNLPPNSHNTFCGPSGKVGTDTLGFFYTCVGNAQEGWWQVVLLGSITQGN